MKTRILEINVNKLNRILEKHFRARSVIVTQVTATNLRNETIIIDTGPGKSMSITVEVEK
jgi:hypothetical protein